MLTTPTEKVKPSCTYNTYNCPGERAMAFQDEVQILTRLGLTSNQAKIYLALCKSGISNAKQVSKNSSVERSETYRIIAKLENLGLIERIISVPCKFRAISSQNAVSVLMKSRIEETSELQTLAKELLLNFKNNSAGTALKEGGSQFILMSEEAATLRKKKAFEKTQRSLEMVTSWKRFLRAVMVIYNREIAKALQRGVEIRVITDKPEDEKSVSDTIKHLKKYPVFKVRYSLDPPTAIILVNDKEEGWVSTCAKAELTKGFCLWTNNTCLLSILQDFFEILWLKAIEYDD